ncbi:mug158 [Symbiodinium necroappetens]|uniref:Mug158 protein n=1 Tax=Symbiodinium necroappetens TaxID=1628268 RepID=A0A813BFP5_9DINO|nr:mug158 [Symbiodinium necroappetens]
MTMCEPNETRWWRTALLMPGMLVKKKGVAELFMVAGSFPHRAAALLWPLKKLTNKVLVPESITRKSQLTWASVLNVLDWQAVEHEIMSPLHLFLTDKSLRSRADLQGQVLIKQNGTVPLLTYLASKGFAGLPLRLELLGHSVEPDGGEGDADEEAGAAADSAEELCENVWAAVTGALECTDARAAEILEKSIALRGPDNKYFDLLKSEEIQDAFKEDDYKDLVKYLENVESRDKVGG